MKDPSTVGLQLRARLKEAGLSDACAQTLAEEFCKLFATKDYVDRTDAIREARTDAKISMSGTRFAVLLAITVVLSGVVGRLLGG